MMEYASQHPGSSPAGDFLRAARKHRVLRALGAAALLGYLLVGRAPEAGAATFTRLTLQNGWTNAPGGLRSPAVSLVAGIVQFDGAMATASSNPLAFTLPVELRPTASVYVPVTLCDSTKGRLVIQPTGTVTVQAEGGNFTNAQCLTSLEGASFALSASGFTALSLNGWTNAPFSTRNAAVANIAGLVRLQGAIATTGTSALAFTLPVGFRPATTVYVPVDLCGAAKGRLIIQPSGDVTVQAASSFSSAQCFTSLEGVAFAPSAAGFTALTLENGWTTTPYGTAVPGFEDIGGVLHFAGAISSGTDKVAFQLPRGFWPATDIYIPLDLCSAAKGRLWIMTNGVANVQAEAGAFSSAQCFTSLDGASFTLTDFAPLALQNGWTSTPYGTADAALANVYGIVHLRGAIANGTSGVAFTLPGGFWPQANVYVPVDLCNAGKGQLLIQSSGVVTVQAPPGQFSNAQCFTSLEGVSFALPQPQQFTGLPPQNGWTNGPLGTRSAAWAVIDGIIRLQGAIASGTQGAASFTLPAGARPATNLYVPVTLCNAAKGRLFITTLGQATVQTEGAFSDALCMTSLEGVAFARSPSDVTPLGLQNGWTSSPFGTGVAAIRDLGGIVQLAGAIATTMSNMNPITLPVNVRPTTNVYVPIDLCSATKGRLFIQPSGAVTVQIEDGNIAHAQCFTSLDGASYAM
jgi:hypothetical protein